LLEKLGQDFLLSRAGFAPRAGLIFLANRADFLNFTVTFSRESVTIFSATCYYFLQNLLLFFQPDVTALLDSRSDLISLHVGKACKAQGGRRPMSVGLLT
jgi:hypothetical protein